MKPAEFYHMTPRMAREFADKASRRELELLLNAIHREARG